MMTPAGRAKYDLLMLAGNVRQQQQLFQVVVSMINDQISV
jgi:hypothetical protein